MTGYVILTCKFHKEDRNWVGFCDELGTSDFGRTLDEAKKRLQEAIVLHLNTLEDVGERKRFFEENGIEIYKYRPKTQTVNVETNSDTFVTSCIETVGELAPA